MIRFLPLLALLACAPHPPAEPPAPETASGFAAAVVASLDDHCPPYQGQVRITYQGGAVEIEHGCRPLESLGTGPKIGRTRP